MTEQLSGWGMFPVVESEPVASEVLARVVNQASICHGLGRAYGDAALPSKTNPVVAHTLASDRILGFSEETGILSAEAGLSLQALMHIYLPRGWFTPVSPGTQFVTLGGMVASDIHGKNHHVHGTFGNFVKRLRLMLANGEIVDCSPERDAPLFWATLGGMGLTGHILEVDVQLEKLPSPWIYEESERYDSLAEIFEALNACSETWPMTVAWIDTSVGGAGRGRGVLMKGRWATAEEAPKEPPKVRMALPVPFKVPSGLLLNSLTIRIANAIWYYKHGSKPKKHIINPENFFYLLDLATNWNRVYGKRGFTQYQCVMPSDLKIYDAFLKRFQDLGGCSFVTVLKDCGPAGKGMLSFPQGGTSMAVDIPITADTPKIIDELNAFILEHGGRIYLAKDAYTSSDDFQKMYPRLPEFLEVKRRVDPHTKVRSAMWDRLFEPLVNQES